MLGLVPSIHVLGWNSRMQDVEGRDKPGHDGEGTGFHLCDSGEHLLRYLDTFQGIPFKKQRFSSKAAFAHA
jgi:hypothetical protein